MFSETVNNSASSYPSFLIDGDSHESNSSNVQTDNPSKYRLLHFIQPAANTKWRQWLGRGACPPRKVSNTWGTKCAGSADPLDMLAKSLLTYPFYALDIARLPLSHAHWRLEVEILLSGGLEDERNYSCAGEDVPHQSWTCGMLGWV